MNVNVLNELIEHFLDEDFGDEQATELLGEPLRQEGSQTTLQPADEGLSRVRLHHEDLRAGPGQLTTIQLDLQPAWKVPQGRLCQALGREPQWLPRPGRNRPRRLCLDRSGKKYEGRIMLTVEEEQDAGDEMSEILVTSILIRRRIPAE